MPYSVDLRRGIDPDQLEQGRHDVDGVDVLMPGAAGPSELAGPVGDERVTDAAFVGFAFPALERGVPGPGPTPGVVVVSIGTAQLIDPGQVLFHVLGFEVEEVQLVERSPGTPLGRGSVVAHDQDDRVLELSDLLDEVEQTSDLGVGVGQKAGVDLHHPGVEVLLLGRERVPGRNPTGPLAQRRTRGEQGRRGLAIEDPVAPGVPSEVELTPVAVDELRRRMVGSMAGSRREPQEEGLLR